jgi:hypothetical protein
MVPSSVLTFSVDGEHLTCCGFYLGESVHLRNFEFITDYFGGLSLSPRRGDSGTTFMGSTHSGPPSPRWVMIEDSTDEFHTASSGGGGSSIPSPRRLGARVPPAPVTTLLCKEDATTIQSMTTGQPWVLAPRLHNDHSFEQQRTTQEGQQVHALAWQPSKEQEMAHQRNKLTGK